MHICCSVGELGAQKQMGQVIKGCDAILAADEAFADAGLGRVKAE